MSDYETLASFYFEVQMKWFFSTEMGFHILKRFLSSKTLVLKLLMAWKVGLAQY